MDGFLPSGVSRFLKLGSDPSGTGGGGGMLLAGFPQKGDLVLCRDSTPIMDLKLFSWTALIYCVIWAEMMYLHCVSLQDYSTGTCYNRVCLDVRVLDATGDRLDVPGTGLLCEGDWVCFSVQAS